ncbi:hypothetical protein GCM10009785_30150 [Brooklawnia cerclae]|uniref:Uncharacterized protein n=1 Tax=Brooklawnia cerclae TaxID=349934 RepID=A0ABX0SFB9_9ACTN|nr:hypothetical protein [Brooklawnia cerclae]
MRWLDSVDLDLHAASLSAGASRMMTRDLDSGIGKRIPTPVRAFRDLLLACSSRSHHHDARESGVNPELARSGKDDVWQHYATGEIWEGAVGRMTPSPKTCRRRMGRGHVN